MSSSSAAAAMPILRLRIDRRQLISWRNFFLVVDRIMHLAEAVHIRPLRSLALKRAEKWMLERLEMTDGLGAIYPAMLNAILALRCLGYSEDDPQVIRARDEFEKLGIEQPPTDEMPEPTFRMQPCLSPVWDTAQALYALGEAGVSRSDPRMIKAADWLLSKEVRHKGDWAVKVPQHRTRRVVLRVQQRVLSRYRRHRPGSARPQQGRQSARALPAPGGSSAPLTGSLPCSAATAAGAASTKTTPR